MTDAPKIPEKLYITKENLTPENVEKINAILKKLMAPQPMGIFGPPKHDLHIKIN